MPDVLPVKTRLWPTLGRAGAERLYRAMLVATADLARRFTDRPIVAYSPPGVNAEERMPELEGCEFLPVDGDDGAACLEDAVARAFDGEHPIVALGGDAPDLPIARVNEGLEAMKDHDAALVPTPDGGFSCLVLRRPVPGLSRAFTYGGQDSFEALESHFERRGLRVAVLEPWPDIDTPEDLEKSTWRAR